MADQKKNTIEDLRARIALVEQCSAGAFSSATDVDKAFELQTKKSPSVSRSKDHPALDADYAFKRLTRLCMQQERSSMDAKARLKRIGFAEDVIEEAISRAQKCGLLSDSRYAEVLVRSRLSQGRGLKGIEDELRRAGIDAWEVDEYQEATQSISPEEEYARALDFLSKHPTRAKNARAAAYRKLVSKGYSSSVAARAAKAWAG